MAGIDRIGSGKGPTGPLPPSNGGAAPHSPLPASPADTGPDLKVDSTQDAITPAVRGQKSGIRAPDELPKAEDSEALPEAVAARMSERPESLGILLASGLPVKGAAGLRRLADRLLASGIAGVQTRAEGDRSVAIGLSGDALSRLRIRIQSEDRIDMLKPSDLGLVGIRFGT